MSDEQVGCEWVTVSSGTGLPRQSRPTEVVPAKGPLNGCVCVCVCVHVTGGCHNHHKSLYDVRIYSWLNTTLSHSARNFGFIFDEHVTFSDQISSVSKSRIRPYLDDKTASTIATSTVHSKLDYCNSLYHNLPKSQITRLQQIQNSLARAVVKAPKSSHITPIPRSLHWLK